MATIDRRGATVSAADPPIGTNPNPDLAIKAPVRVATTGSNITLSGLQTIDGVATAAGDRVLVKDQTDKTTNGIYNAATGPWTRTIDAASNARWARGVQVTVTDGTANSGTNWECTATSPITLGTTLITWSQSTNPLSSLVMPASTVLANPTGSPATATPVSFPIITGGTKAQIVVKNSPMASDASWYDDLWLNIEAFGGKGDNLTDNLTPYLNALAALSGQGGGVYFPPGKYKFSANAAFNLPGGIFSVAVIGAGQDATELIWPNLSGGLTFNFAGISSSVHIRDLTLSAGQPSGGTAINLEQTVSVVNVGVAATTDIYRVTLRGSDGYRQTNYWTTGLNINNVSGIQVDNLTVSGSSSQQGVGTSIVGLPGSSTYAVLLDIAKSNYFGLATGLVYGSFVQGLTVDQTNFTFVTTGISSAPGESGALVQLAVANSQFNPGQASGGVGINTGTFIGGLQIVNNFFVIGGPSQFGIVVQQAGHYCIAFNQIQGLNSTGSFGIVIGARISGAPGMVSHNDIYGFGNSGTGIWLQSSSQSVLVDGNLFANNTTTIFNLGTGNSIRNNFGNPAIAGGYNPVGISGPFTVGASTFTVTAGASPETHYLNQSATNTATVSKSGITVANLKEPSTYYMVELEPNESYAVTWATTAPTYTKDVH
jgi:hypothetical protein